MGHVSTASEKKDVLSAVHFTEGGEFRPTLVIGLGGSGVETARRLKRILNQRYKMNNLISFLFMDTDEGVYTANGELANVEEFERASVAVRNPEQLVEELRKNPKLHPYFHEFLDDSIDVVILKNAIGAAGIRPVGRFAFHASFDTIYPKYVSPAIERIMGVQTLAKAMMLTAEQQVTVAHSHPRIYIISSLCGGTGSGIFFDTAVVVRHLLEQNNLDGEIVGIFYLPSVFRHESGISSTMMEVIEANAYAGLMELEYFSNPKRIQEERWTFTYPMIGMLTLKEPLFDEVFLVEGTNASGQSVNDKRVAFEMVARSLMLDIGSPLGARARSAKRNSIAVIETIPCAETSEPRLMNSLAVTNLSIPIEELTRYCAARAAIEAWFDRDGQRASDNLPQQVETFLKTHSMDVSENSDSLIEHLLVLDNSRLHYSLPQKQDLLNQAENAGHKRWEDKLNYVAQRLQEEFERIRTRWLPEQVTTLQKKAEEHLQKALDAAGRRAEEILNSHGHEAASAFLHQLATAIDEVQKALTARIKNKEEAISEAEQGFWAKCRTLKEAKVKWGGIVGPPSEVAAIDEAIDHLKTFADAGLYCEAAHAVLQALERRAAA
ncbi:MAG: tubulin-like doman-containing protein, partial [Armatimonadota bacterium]